MSAKTLREALDDYLAVRRTLGFKLARAGLLLEQFVAFCEAAGVERVTAEVAIAWACQPDGASPSWLSHRLSVVRSFAGWLQAADPSTDLLDSVWLAKLAERSMLSPSFVPAEQMRQVRDLARARFELVEDRARVKQRVEKVLEDALVKISSVLTDVHGVSGRQMVEALIVGERDPMVLAGHAKGRARARLSELAEALPVPSLSA